jgi:hypothetical protein
MGFANRILKTQEDVPGWFPQAVTAGSGLDAYLRREPQPPPEFPTSKEQVEIAGSADVAIDQIRRHLNKQRRGG